MLSSTNTPADIALFDDLDAYSSHYTHHTTRNKGQCRKQQQQCQVIIHQWLLNNIQLLLVMTALLGCAVCFVCICGDLYRCLPFYVAFIVSPSMARVACALCVCSFLPP